MSARLLRPRAPSGFNPRTLSGLSAWYDASVTSSVTLTGGFVSQWNDLSGNGINLSQSTEANRPGTATVNGRQAIDFDGSNDNLNNTTEVTPGTVFNVHIIDTAAGQSVYGVQSGSGATVRSSSLIFSSLGEYRSQSIASGFNAGFSGGSRTANPRISVHTFSGAAVAGRLDGAGFGGTTTTTGTNVNGVWLGTRNIGGVLSLPMDGKICEHLIYNRVLSADEISRVERYLAAKWGVTLYSPPSFADADANAYITAVEAADGQAMETGVRNAINDFVLGCKADGIWTAIKSSCLLMGARTLSGALTPLVGSAPTNNGPFVSGDYDRKLGLAGNGTSKYLDTNRTGSADPQDSMHMSFYFGAARGVGAFMGAGAVANGTTQIAVGSASNVDFRSRSSTAASISSASTVGFVGVSRAESASFVTRIVGASATQSIASQTPLAVNSLLFARNSSAGVAGLFSASRISYYSIGEGLDLALLDARVAALSTAIGAAI
jgi:hypothetical protein